MDFWYRKKKEGGVLDSINKDKKRDEHAREEIRKQAKKNKRKGICNSISNNN